MWMTLKREFSVARNLPFILLFRPEICDRPVGLPDKASELRENLDNLFSARLTRVRFDVAVRVLPSISEIRLFCKSTWKRKKNG